MRTERARGMAGIAILASLLMVAPAATAPLAPWAVPGPVGDRALPMDAPAPWVDTFDDSSKVNTTRDAEVVSGEVRVAAGMLRGVVASVEIACPTGYRYDILLVEASTPGASTVKVSVLNATRESQQVGYVNDPVPGFERRSERDVPLTTISPGDFPRIRLQADLETSGTDQPALLMWAVHFVPMDEWRDDFYGRGKMTGATRLNISGGMAELNLAMKNSIKLSYAAYEAYPPILANSVDQGNQIVFYPNTGHSAYGGATTIPSDATFGSAAGDVDVDGYTDLFVTCYRSGSDYTRSSMILWGDSSGTWRTTDATLLQTDSARKPALGDVNGDGLLDVLVCSGGGGSAYVAVFLNPGTRTWAGTSDINLPASNFNNGGAVGVADLDGDGYEDAVLAENYPWSGGSYSRAYLGGPDGPDTTPDIHFKTGATYDVDLADYNRDGFPDVAFADNLQVSGADRAHVFISDKGAFEGNSSTYQLDVPYSNEIMDVDSGDIEGNGWVDLVFGRRGGGGSQRMYVFWGGATGFSNSNRDDPQIAASMNDNIVIDVDKDGYGDVISASRYANRIDIYKGSSSGIDGTADMGLNTNAPLALAVGVGRERLPYLYGTFTTTEIARPLEDKWDILVLEGDFPAGTEARVTVLDNGKSPILGFTDMRGTDIDLSPIDVPLIYVRVEIRSTDRETTPSVDRLLVNWMPKGAWREQFYGKGKAERFVNVDIGAHELRAYALDTDMPQLLVTSLRTDAGYGSHPELYLPRNDLDYASTPPMDIAAVGTSAASVGDVNGDGFQDVVLAVHRTSDTGYASQSPLFLNSQVGWRSSPDHAFPTTGASDVLLHDIDGDGNLDVVFAQETDGVSFAVNSTLFWGRDNGTWSDVPDVEFSTKGASGVVAADIDMDGDADLAFACYRDMVSTATDSMVFLQDAAGFCGTAPSYLLPTRGARAVDASDVNGDTRVDLAFANSFSGGFSEIDSYVYWGKAGGGFEATPALLRTRGAEDVKLVDVDLDGHLDAAFANYKDNTGSNSVESGVYLNDGSGGFGSTPDLEFPTTGAYAVELVEYSDLRERFLIYACHNDGASYDVGSVAFVVAGTVWPSTPTFTLPTKGATDVLPVGLITRSRGGYMSKAIVPEDPDNTGAFHTVRYTARLGTGQTAQLRLVDSQTWEVLAETEVQAGAHELVVKDAFRFKEHRSVRVVVTANGLNLPGDFAIDDLWLNWTKRVKEAPRVLDLGVSATAVPRLATGEITVNVTDEYDLPGDLRVVVEHRLGGASTWSTSMLSAPSFSGGAWRVTLRPRADAQVGTYDLRADVTDSDGISSGAVEFLGALSVLNNVPTAPVVRVTPDAPTTLNTLQVEIVTSATDLESAALGYRYQWFVDGVANASLTSDTVTAPFTERGQNWSVEVRAFDGLDESAPATAWVVIVNAPPQMKVPLPNPEIVEDSVDDQWLDLSTAFEDPDGDTLVYTMNPLPEHIKVTIDPATGKVTLRPGADWSGQEGLTFIASDGEFSVSRSCLVTVTPVNDRPRFKTVNDQPITSDPVAFTIDQGEQLVINVLAEDVEGDELVFSANSTIIQVDGSTGRITFQPDNNEVGTLRFALTLYDTVTPSSKVTLNFTITVRNTNDPVDAPRIINPRQGDKFKTGVTFSLIGACTDPDTQYGQQLTFKWYWNGTNLIGEGTSLTWNFTSPGTFNITLTVSDGEFTKEAWALITIEPKDIPTPPPPPPNGDGDGDEGGISMMMVIGVLVVLVIIGAVMGLMIARRREQRIEDAEIAKEEEADRRETLKRIAMTARTTADAMELQMGKASVEGKEGGLATHELEEVTIESRAPSGEASMVSSAGMEDRMLSMKPKETEAASKETMALFKDMARTETAASAADQDEMRVDNLKRKYQNAIGRLPYGIPAQELRGMDWVELAGLLATGEKRTLPDGRETTQIKGRWYYSDASDTSTFLTEHGAKPKAEPRRAAAAAPTMDRAALLAKLEERLILGEISEETYRELKRKYEGTGGGGAAKGGEFEWEEAEVPK